MTQLSHRRIDLLLSRYAESHCNPVNEMIHCICVPAIMFALLGLIWSVAPVLAVLMVAAALAYYLQLSQPFAVAMLALAASMLLLLWCLPTQLVLPVSLIIFVVAWIGQFIGHKIEGKRPSFFDDLRFLLIGPLFIVSLLFRRLHIRY